MLEGAPLGFMDGSSVGAPLGAIKGDSVGEEPGMEIIVLDGAALGVEDGCVVGAKLSTKEGDSVGAVDGVMKMHRLANAVEYFPAGHIPETADSPVVEQYDPA